MRFAHKYTPMHPAQHRCEVEQAMREQNGKDAIKIHHGYVDIEGYIAGVKQGDDAVGEMHVMITKTRGSSAVFFDMLDGSKICRSNEPTGKFVQVHIHHARQLDFNVGDRIKVSARCYDWGIWDGKTIGLYTKRTGNQNIRILGLPPANKAKDWQACPIVDYWDDGTVVEVTEYMSFIDTCYQIYGGFVLDTERRVKRWWAKISWAKVTKSWAN